MGQALYRKYRSKSLGEVVGQEHITKALEGSLKAGRISHAYLFTGPHGVGKTSIARILAHEINQLPYTDEPQLDIIEIDAASNRRIDDIRDLREKVHIAPVNAKYKVYIIDEVHMLTGESFNALLKTLEEPPEHAVFILATTEVHKLPATIVSRTQRYGFRPIPPAKVVAHLRTIADQEKITIDDDALQLLAEHGNGSFRDSIGLLDQLANVAGGTIGSEMIEQTLGLAPRTAIDELLTHLKNGEHKAIVQSLTELENNGTSTAVLVGQLLNHLRQQVIDNPQLLPLIDNLLDVPKAHNPQLKLLTTLLRFVATTESKSAAANTVTTRAVFETAARIVDLKQAHKQHEKIEKPAEEKPNPAVASAPSKPLESLDEGAWAQILQSAKQVSPALYSVLRQAQPGFDAASNTLTLTFRFALHSKKLEGAERKAALAKLIAEVLGGAPQIATAVSKDAAPLEVELPTQPAPEIDEQTKSVLAMMGGGDIVHAETI